MSPEKDNLNEEVDVRLIYHKIKQLFSSFFHSLINFTVGIITMLRKRWGLILISFLIGIGIGFGIYYNTRPVYSSTLVLTSTVLRNDFCFDMINSLDQLVKEKAYDPLAKKLGMPVASARSIKGLDIDNYDEKLKKKYDNKDTIVLGLPFKIKAYAYTNTVFDTLQQALVKYLENNDYSLKRKKIKIETTEMLRAKLASEIRQVDSLKFVVASGSAPRGNQGGFVFGQPIDPLNMFHEGINLFKEDLNLYTSLSLIENIQVVQDFSLVTKPSFPKLRYNLPLGGLIGLLAGLIVAFYLEAKKRKRDTL